MKVYVQKLCNCIIFKHMTYVCSVLTGLSYSIEIYQCVVIYSLTFFIEIYLYSVFSSVLKMTSIQIQCSFAFRTICISRLEPKIKRITPKKKKLCTEKKATKISNIFIVRRHRSQTKKKMNYSLSKMLMVVQAHWAVTNRNEYRFK